jgi:hypothetical protein
MTKIVENLRANDLNNLVKKVFGIDAYKSKIGDDEDIMVLNFIVQYEDPAKDLENFIEMGYDFVLDADVSAGETDDGDYIVFVELERNRHAVDYILKLLKGIEQLTGIEDMRFRYFKNFKSHAATKENLIKVVPLDKNQYEDATNRNVLENFINFFDNSFVDDITLLDESIIFRNGNKSPIMFNIITSGTSKEVYSKIKGPIMLEHKDIADVLYLTKYIGPYNINKINNTYIFETNNYAVALEKV